MALAQSTLPVSSAMHGIAATVPSVSVGGTSTLDTVDMGMPTGDIIKMDVAIAAGVDATISVRVYSRAAQAAGSVYTLVEFTGVTGDFHQELQTLFANTDTPQTSLLYVEVQHTAGTQATGSVTIIFWVTG